MTSIDQSPPGHRWPVRVYYEDTDAAGVVYYANYLRFCERARTEWLRSVGFQQKNMLAGQGLAFVVSRVEADYLKSAELDDAIEVCSTIDNLGRASVIFRQTVVRGTETLFVARVTVACVDWAKRRPVPLPDTLRSLLEIPA
ncbi:MAG TPA: tol-pal system-associated acyl-CoA thioesterase [Rhodocyclaceae bacterium]|nr:tol-pal system-associated acyl-CoA thioesterase [Rhodocyclaceae bacterium]